MDTTLIPHDTVLVGTENLKLDNGVYYLSNKPFSGYVKSDYPKWNMPDANSFHKIRAFSLVDQEGATFTEKNLDGKICVADFFFTSCLGVCPKMAESMSVIQKEFLYDKDVLHISHYVTPGKVLKKEN